MAQDTSLVLFKLSQQGDIVPVSHVPWAELLDHARLGEVLQGDQYGLFVVTDPEDREHLLASGNVWLGDSYLRVVEALSRVQATFLPRTNLPVVWSARGLNGFDFLIYPGWGDDVFLARAKMIPGTQIEAKQAKTTLFGTPGLRYSLQKALSPVGPWTELRVIAADGLGDLHIDEPVAVGGRAFYRAIPAP